MFATVVITSYRVQVYSAVLTIEATFSGFMWGTTKYLENCIKNTVDFVCYLLRKFKILFQLSALSVASNYGDCDNILYLFVVDDVHCSIVGASVDWTSQEACSEAISAATSGTIL